MRLSAIYGIDVVQQVPEGVDEALGEDPGAEDLAGGQVDEDGHQRQVDLQLLRLDSGRMFTTRDRVQDGQNLLWNRKNRITNFFFKGSPPLFKGWLIHIRRACFVYADFTE